MKISINDSKVIDKSLTKEQRDSFKYQILKGIAEGMKRKINKNGKKRLKRLLKSK